MPCSTFAKGQNVSRACNATSDTVCQSCSCSLPAGAFFPVAGSCNWQCSLDYSLVGGKCVNCSSVCGTGSYRAECSPVGSGTCVPCSTSICTACTNKPPSRVATYLAADGTIRNATISSNYTSGGAWRANNCSWTCLVGYYPHPRYGCTACSNKPTGILPQSNWTCVNISVETACYPTYLNVSFYTSPGTLGGNNCAWACSPGFHLSAGDCVR